MTLGLASQSHAQLYWGANDSGGAGTWNHTTTVWYNGTSNQTWTSGDIAIFDETGGAVTVSGSQTVGGLTFNTTGYSLTGGNLEGTSSGFTVQDNYDATVDSNILGGSPFTTTFTKSGSGTLTLGGADSFFGQIDVTGGSLVLSEGFDGATSPVMAGTVAVTLAGGSLGATNTGTPIAQNFGTLSLQSNAVINFSNSTNLAISFADSSSQTWTGTLTIENFNSASDTLQFGTSSGGLTAAQLSDIVFAGSGDSAVINSNGLISAVPEPNSIALFLIGICILVGAWFKKTFSCRPN